MKKRRYNTKYFWSPGAFSFRINFIFLMVYAKECVSVWESAYNTYWRCNVYSIAIYSIVIDKIVQISLASYNIKNILIAFFQHSLFCLILHNNQGKNHHSMLRVYLCILLHFAGLCIHISRCMCMCVCMCLLSILKNQHIPKSNRERELRLLSSSTNLNIYACVVCTYHKQFIN